MLEAGIAISAHSGDSRASLTSDADCSTRWPGEIANLDHRRRLGRRDRQCRRDRRFVGQAGDIRIRQPAEPKHLPPFGQRDAGLPGLGLARLHHALRHRLAFEQFGVPSQLLRGKHVLRGGMQIVALQRHEARALQGDEPLARRDPVATGHRETGDHAGHRRADHPQLRRRDHDLSGIGQRLIGSAGDGMRRRVRRGSAFARG